MNMKRAVSIVMAIVFWQGLVLAQDFVLSNPSMSVSPAEYPGGKLTASFDLYILGGDFTFGNGSGQGYGTIIFRFTKLNPSGKAPKGDGADLFRWKLSSNDSAGADKVYTWTGTSKETAEMKRSPGRPKYKIIFSDIEVAMGATQVETDIRITGRFNDPAGARANSGSNNYAEIATYSVAGKCVPGVDYGDLAVKWKPASAKVISADCNNDGIPDGPGASVWAGAGVSYEEAAKATDNADGDDYDDGLALPSGTIIPGANNYFMVTLSTNAAGGAKAYYGLWFDWNNDGDFTNDYAGAGQSVSNFYKGSGMASANGTEINAAVLFPKQLNPMYKIRLIVSDKPVNKNDYAGQLANGEVEDYQVTNSAQTLVFNSFNASSTGCLLNVDWKMGAGQFITGYEVEISKNGIDYKKVAEQKAGGQDTYTQFIDLSDQVKASAVYVRIKAIDIKGFARYSEVKMVTGLCAQDGMWTVTLFPNPVANTRQVTISATKGMFDGSYRLTLIDNSGRMIQTKAMTLNKITQINYQLPATMAAGKYRLEVKNINNTQTALLDFIKL